MQVTKTKRGKAQCQLHAASDIMDEFRHNGQFYTKKHLDAMMAYLASLGVTCHEWVFEEGRTTLYEDYPGGFDLLHEAIHAAHRHGIELHVVLKPFEAVPSYAPHTLPQPEDVVWTDLRGVMTSVMPFVVQHPEYCLRRRSEPLDHPGPTTAIKLVKADDNTTRIRPEHLSIWMSDKLGRFEQYDKPFTVTESVEWRTQFPRSGWCRTLTLSDLEIPEEQKYIEVRLSSDCPEDDFSNEADFLVELQGPEGEPLPITPSTRIDPGFGLKERLSSNIFQQVSRYLKQPDVQKFMETESLDDHLEGIRSFETRGRMTMMRNFADEGRATVARGKNERLPILHPIYPAVRHYWMAKIRHFLDRGADGVNLRPGTHFRCNEPWAYGYNEPVLERCHNPDNLAEIARVNSEAVTQLVKEASELVRSNNKQFGVHILQDAFRKHDDQGKILPEYPFADWSWQQWIQEYADYVEFRGTFGYREPNARQMVDRVALAAREAAIPFILQSNRRVVTFSGPEYADWRKEMTWAVNHPDIDAYQLYETNNFTRLNEAGTFEGSPELPELLKDFNWTTQ